MLVKKRQKFDIEDLLSRGVENVIVKESLVKKLKSGKVLRVKHGVDPTTSNLHLGHAVIYEKLRQFQELGHTIVFLIGTFTARFGDPVDQLTRRNIRTKEEVEAIAKDYVKQLSHLLDTSRIDVRMNGEWYDRMSAEDLLRLVSKFTVARMLERDMFQKRMKEKKDIGLHEPIYPLLQGYDSVMIQSDVTVVGTDQLFNELQARPLQEEAHQTPQDIMAVLLLLGTDGHRKMSQSLGNDIKLQDSPMEQFGKVMSIPDTLILSYFELATRVSTEEIQEIKHSLKQRENPRDVKLRLAEEIVTIHHSAKDAIQAREEFTRVFSKKENPREIPKASCLSGQHRLADLLVQLGLSKSKSEVRRLVEQGGVKVDGRRIHNWMEQVEIKKGTVIQVGKRKFMEIE